jgi:hypothetical protein
MSLKHDEHTELAALEGVLSRLDEVGAAFGAEAGAVVDAVRRALIEAMAARDRGDMPAALATIGRAMDRLTLLADDMVDPAEGAMMRAVAQAFRAALLRGDYSDAKQAAAVMMRQSGALERKKS